jgi:hypothetical protein
MAWPSGSSTEHLKLNRKGISYPETRVPSGTSVLIPGGGKGSVRTPYTIATLVIKYDLLPIDRGRNFQFSRGVREVLDHRPE